MARSADNPSRHLIPLKSDEIPLKTEAGKPIAKELATSTNAVRAPPTSREGICRKICGRKNAIAMLPKIAMRPVTASATNEVFMIRSRCSASSFSLA